MDPKLIRDLIEHLRLPHPRQKEIDSESVALLRDGLPECPQCGRKIVGKLNRCAHCEGD